MISATTFSVLCVGNSSPASGERTVTTGGSKSVSSGGGSPSAVRYTVRSELTVRLPAMSNACTRNVRWPVLIWMLQVRTSPEVVHETYCVFVGQP